MKRLAVGGLVRLNDGGLGMARQGLLQRHARGHPHGGREEVDDHRPAAGVVDDDGGPAAEMRLPSQLDPCPQVCDEHAGDPQGASSVTRVPGTTGDEDNREQKFSMSKGR